MTTFLLILGGVLALAAGLFWGGSGRYDQTPEEIDRALGAGGRTRRVKRRFTALNWLRKDQRSSHQRRRRGGRRFQTMAPEDRDKK